MAHSRATRSDASKIIPEWLAAVDLPALARVAEQGVDEILSSSREGLLGGQDALFGMGWRRLGRLREEARASADPGRWLALRSPSILMGCAMMGSGCPAEGAAFALIDRVAKLGVDVDALGGGEEMGMRPLAMACSQSDFKGDALARLLISHGANPMLTSPCIGDLELSAVDGARLSDNPKLAAWVVQEWGARLARLEADAIEASMPGASGQDLAGPARSRPRI